MIKSLTEIGTVLLNIFLIFVAVLLVIVLAVPALIWKIYVSISEENRKARDILNGSAEFFKAIAISVDVFGGVAYSGLFNRYLLKNQVYKFGSPYETISEVLGWAQYYGDLTKTGKALVKILDFIDKDHCEKTRVHGILLAGKKLKQKRL